MATKTTMATNFSPETVSEVFSKVKGHSSIIKLAQQMPVAFSGNDMHRLYFYKKQDIDNHRLLYLQLTYKQLCSLLNQ